MNYLVFVSLLALTACKSVLVIESSDPKVKLTDGYRMLETGRSLPALRLFTEANEIAKARSDDSFTAQTFVSLGDLYKFKDGNSQTAKTYDAKKAIASFEEAAKYLEKLKYNQRLSMAYYGISQVYAQELNNEKSCEYLNKAAKTFYKGSGGPDDELNTARLANVLPYFQHSKAQKFNATCGHQ